MLRINMRRLELLIDALELDGHPKIREKIKGREELVDRESTLRIILTPVELDTVRNTLDSFKPPSPNSWSQALWIHALKDTISGYSPDRPFSCTELGNLITTLYQADLSEPEILRKLINAAKAMKRYEDGGDPE